MATFEEWTLFLASPGDVNPERDAVRKVVEEINDTLGRVAQVRVRVIGWDTDGRPSWGTDAQKILNRQIGDMKKHALFVGIFWNRIGTPTPRARSGTIEEFKNAARLPKSQRPEIMLYFNEKAATLNASQARQRAELLEWKESLQPDGLYWQFKGTRNFETLFRRQYGDWFREQIQGRVGRVLSAPLFSSATAAAQYLSQKAKEEPPVSKAGPKPRARKAVVSKTKGQPFLLNGDLYFADSITETGSTWKFVVRPHSPADDRKLRSLNNQSQLSLAYDLQAGHAHITKPGERYSDDKGVFWTLELRFSPIREATTINFGNMNADEIAQKKAEWLLLAKSPVSQLQKMRGKLLLLGQSSKS